MKLPRYIRTGLVHSSSPSIQHFNDMSYLQFIQSMGARAYGINNEILSSIQPSSSWCRLSKQWYTVIFIRIQQPQIYLLELH